MGEDVVVSDKIVLQSKVMTVTREPMRVEEPERVCPRCFSELVAATAQYPDRIQGTRTSIVNLCSNECCRNAPHNGGQRKRTFVPFRGGITTMEGSLFLTRHDFQQLQAQGSSWGLSLVSLPMGTKGTAKNLVPQQIEGQDALF